MKLHFRPLPPPGLVTTLFGFEDPWATLRADIDRLIEERPAGGYKLLLTDWPWRFNLRSAKGEGKSPQRHYKTIPIEVIAALPIWQLMATDSIMLQWCTSPMLNQQIVMAENWGFTYKQEAPWWKGSKNSKGEPGDDEFKAAFAGGYLWRNCHESLVMFMLGEPDLLDARRKERAAFFDATREHSRKPDDIYRKAETLIAGPKLELFSRTDRAGWKSFGDQAGMFGDV